MICVFAPFFPFILGFLCICIAWPGRRLIRDNFFLKLFLGAGLGLGITSITFFIWLLLSNSSIGHFAIIETILFIFLTVVLIYRNRQKNQRFDIPIIPEKKTLKYSWIFPISFYIALNTALLSFLNSFHKNPHGGWDGWAIWNMRARFIFRAGELWKGTFSEQVPWTHPDYPLLIPLNIVRSWKYLGMETVAIPAFYALIITFSTIVLILLSLFFLRSKSQGFLAGLVLLGTTSLIKTGAFQTADVPLAFFFLATFVLFCLESKFENNNYILILFAGMTAAFSAWTKNEGLLFITAVISGRLFAAILLQEWKKSLKHISVLLLGIVPILVFILYFKIQLAPVNDLISGQSWESITSKVFDLSRYTMILTAYGKAIVNFGGFSISIVLFLSFYACLLGARITSREKLNITASIISLSLMLIGYFFVYLLTPLHLQYHLKSSLDRLLLQLWPSIVFIYFMIIKTPEQAQSSYLPRRIKLMVTQ